MDSSWQHERDQAKKKRYDESFNSTGLRSRWDPDPLPPPTAHPPANVDVITLSDEEGEAGVDDRDTTHRNSGLNWRSGGDGREGRGRRSGSREGDRREERMRIVRGEREGVRRSRSRSRERRIGEGGGGAAAAVAVAATTAAAAAASRGPRPIDDDISRQQSHKRRRSNDDGNHLDVSFSPLPPVTPAHTVTAPLGTPTAPVRRAAATVSDPRRPPTVLDPRLAPTVPPVAPQPTVDTRYAAYTVPTNFRAPPLSIPHCTPTVLASLPAAAAPVYIQHPEYVPSPVPKRSGMNCCSLINHHNGFYEELMQWRRTMDKNFHLHERYRLDWEDANGGEFERVREENGRMSQEYGKLRHEFDRLRDEYAKVTHRLAESGRRIDTLEKDLEFTNCELQQSTADVMKDSTKLAQALEDKNRLSHAHTDVLLQKTQIEEEKMRLSLAYKEVLQQRTLVETKHKEEMLEQARTVAQLRAQIFSLQHENGELKKNDGELTTLREELKETNMALDVAQTEFKVQTVELEMCKEDWKRERDSLLQQLQQLQQAVNGRVYDKQRTVDDMERLRREYQQKLEQFARMGGQKPTEQGMQEEEEVVEGENEYMQIETVVTDSDGAATATVVENMVAAATVVDDMVAVAAAVEDSAAAAAVVEEVAAAASVVEDVVGALSKVMPASEERPSEEIIDGEKEKEEETEKEEKQREKEREEKEKEKNNGSMEIPKEVKVEAGGVEEVWRWIEETAISDDVVTVAAIMNATTAAAAAAAAFAIKGDETTMDDGVVAAAAVMDAAAAPAVQIKEEEEIDYQLDLLDAMFTGKPEEGEGGQEQIVGETVDANNDAAAASATAAAAATIVPLAAAPDMLNEIKEEEPDESDRSSEL